MHDSDKSNLLSIALGYVTDEMSSERRAEFELRLAEDQSAREAVARAVCIAEGVRFALASSPQLPQPTVSRMQRATPLHYHIWPAAVAAAACLAVAFILQFSSHSRMETTGGPMVSDSVGALNSQIVEAEHLVAVWSQSELAVASPVDALFAGNFDSDDQQQLTADDFENRGGFENSDVFENSDGYEYGTDVENGVGAPFLVPGWMLAAVSSSLDLEEIDPSPTDSHQSSQEN